MIKKTKQLTYFLYHHKLIRYLAVGGTAFIIDEGLLIILHGQLDVWLPLAVIVAYLIAFFYTFFLNRKWTFSAWENKSLAQHIVPFATLCAFNLIFNIIFISLASHIINYAVAKAMAVIIQTSWTYLIYKNIIFTTEKATT